jgi:hypothetical protein
MMVFNLTHWAEGAFAWSAAALASRVQCHFCAATQCEAEHTPTNSYLVRRKCNITCWTCQSSTGAAWCDLGCRT